jgi:anaerobic magnesium-protoporphyrin IX monomethyl ester cyclase
MNYLSPKNFLTVIPRFAFPGEFYFFPIGIGYITSYLKKAGFNVYCVNLCHSNKSTEEQLIPFIKSHDIDVICSGVMTVHWNLLEEIFTTVKKHFPEKITVAGGAIITSEPDVAMLNMPIDFGVMGEGEITMAELASELCNGNMFPESVPGLIFHAKSGELVKTGERQPITDLDILPFPDYEAMEYDKFLTIRWNSLPSIKGIFFDIDENQRLGEILTSRSCPYSCTFCYHPLGKKYRQRSLDNVFLEIEYLVSKYNIRVLNILDELFSLDEDRIREFCQRIKKYKLIWLAQWRVDNINSELLKECKASGLTFLGLGVESMSNVVLKSMKKNITTVQVNEAFRITAEAGINATGNLIFGDINETAATMNESLKWFFDNPALDINLAMIRAIPDSEIWRYVVNNGQVKDKKMFFTTNLPNINFSKLSDHDYAKCEKIVKKCGYLHYALRGRELESFHQNEFYNGKRIYQFMIKCPACNGVSSYRHYSIINRPLSPVICKSCQRMLAVKTGKIFYKDYSFLKMLFFEFIINKAVGKIRLFYVFHLKKYRILKTIGNRLKKILKMK